MELKSKAASRWLASRREDLNARYREAAKRYPRLDPESFASALVRAIEPLAGDEPAADVLLSSVFDLVLLHAGRTTLGRDASIEVLLFEGLPNLRPLLLEQPDTLPAALSNAVENLGSRGLQFARRIVAASEGAGNARQLRELGVLLAWRLGEPRLRRAALQAAPGLPERTVLDLLGLDDWPDDRAPVALASLESHAWVHPRERVPDPRARSAAELVRRVSASDPAPVEQWRDTARIGAFAGFDGKFLRPPRLLVGGDDHSFYVRSGSATYLMVADLFGWVCLREIELDRRINAPFDSPQKSGRGGSPPPEHVVVRVGGWLEQGDHRVRRAWLARVTSYAAGRLVVATTHSDSHRIRITAPVLELE